MFTGIIEEIGIIESITRSSRKNSLTILCRKILEDIKLGDSISVNGICLTVNSFNHRGFTVDVMPITFQKTNLQNCQNGNHVNLERALQLQSRLGGHLVSGHIDGVGKIQSIIRLDNALIFSIAIAPEQRKFLIPEGSICLDGISLTIFELGTDFMKVSLIPETMKNTIMQYKKAGDLVNLETDMIGKYLYNFLQNNEKKDISLAFLKENGFA